MGDLSYRSKLCVRLLLVREFSTFREWVTLALRRVIR